MKGNPKGDDNERPVRRRMNHAEDGFLAGLLSVLLRVLLRQVLLFAEALGSGFQFCRIIGQVSLDG